MTRRAPRHVLPGRSRSGRILLALGRASTPALLLAVAACTSFDGAVADQGYLDFAEATAVCARVFSCPHLASSLRQSIGAPVDDSDFSVCLGWLAGPSPAPPTGFPAVVEALRRVARATSCEAAAEGLSVTTFAPDDPRCEGGSADRCSDDGDVVDCHDHRLVRCSLPPFAPGSRCIASGEDARCALGLCLAVADVFGCDEGILSVCEPGVSLDQQIVCGDVGTPCVIAADPLGSGPGGQDQALCTAADNPAPTAICADNGAVTCTPDGASAVLCQHIVRIEPLTELGAVQLLFRCDDDLGFRCSSGEPGALASCVRPDPECSPGDADVDRCDGDSIEVCITGRRARVDCASAGARCDPGPGASSARCVLSL